MGARRILTGMKYRRMSATLGLAALALLGGCEDDPGPAQNRDQSPARTAGAQSSAAKPAVSESDLGGVPVYEGGEIIQEQSSKSITGKDGALATGTFEVRDPPPKVTNFYRRKLEEIGAGKTVMETVLPTGGVMLMVDDPATNKAVQVEITPLQTGSRVKVIAVEFPTG
jgi:hypothetical protein